MTDPLPASLDLERLVLGAVMLDGTLMDALRSTVTSDDLSLDRHKRIWAAMCRVYDAGAGVDRLTVHQNLQDSKEAESVGGLSYLIDLDSGLPHFPNLDSYISTLKEKSALRQLVNITDSIRRRTLAGLDSSDTLRASLGSALTEMGALQGDSGPISTREMIDREGVDGLLRPRRTEGIRLPWNQMNDVLCGLHPGQMIAVGAATGRGKTSFALQIAAHVTRQGKSPFVWTLEMTPRQNFVRMVNQMAFSNSDRARQDALSPQEREKRQEAAYWLHGHPVWFDARSRTIPSFAASVRAARAKSDLGLLIVDYLQLVRSAGRAQSRREEVGENSRSLKLLALELELPIIVLSQFKRVEQGQNGAARDYTIHDLKEAGEIENDSDVILIMNGPKMDGDRELPIRLNIGKQREGPTGFDVQLTFHPPSQSFFSPEER